MVKSYSVKFTQKAIDDLDNIYSYISGELIAEDAATNILERIEASIMRILYGRRKCQDIL